MVKNNPDEAVKELIRLNEELTDRNEECTMWYTLAKRQREKIDKLPNNIKLLLEDE